jgi:2,4-dienoyl-CoA reductase-like NADH-dependent reductase (Old Yellow Enzyme family)
MLFSPMSIRSVTLRNRVGVSPMCQYHAVDGVVNDWHLMHLGARAAGGAGLVIAEATAVEAIGRITPGCAGIWTDEQARAWARVARFVSEMGSVPAIQLAHAGRKASTPRPWDIGPRGTLPSERGGWSAIGVTDQPFGTLAAPRAMTHADIERVTGAFAAAASRALSAGFRIVEIHAAHGYLLHSFLSPLSNTRTDEFGGSFENRTRFLMRAVGAVRGVWPAELPLFVRLSATDWDENGWTVEDSVTLARLLREAGVDVIDCSSGGATPAGGTVKTPRDPGFQVPLASRVRAGAKIATAAVGMITDAAQAEAIIAEGHADVVLVARQSLRDPNLAYTWAKQLGRAGELKLTPAYEYWIGSEA